MKALTEWFKDKKKIIVVVLLIILLIAAVFLFFGGESNTSVLGDAMKSDTELRLTALLESMDGIDSVEVMVTEDEGVVTGVVVVCDGADRIMIRNDILNVVSTALNINKNIIAIYSM